MSVTRMKTFSSARDHFDWALFLVASALAVIGVINLYSATSAARAGLTGIYVQHVYWLGAGGIPPQGRAGGGAMRRCAGVSCAWDALSEAHNGLRGSPWPADQVPPSAATSAARACAVSGSR